MVETKVRSGWVVRVNDRFMARPGEDCPYLFGSEDAANDYVDRVMGRDGQEWGNVRVEWF